MAVEGYFVDIYYPTIENNFSKVVKDRSQDFVTEIVDTAGQVDGQGVSALQSRLRRASPRSAMLDLGPVMANTLPLWPPTWEAPLPPLQPARPLAATPVRMSPEVTGCICTLSIGNFHCVDGDFDCCVVLRPAQRSSSHLLIVLSYYISLAYIASFS